MTRAHLLALILSTGGKRQALHMRNMAIIIQGSGAGAGSLAGSPLGSPMASPRGGGGIPAAEGGVELLRALFYFANVCNPCRPWAVYQHWHTSVMSELYLQVPPFANQLKPSNHAVNKFAPSLVVAVSFEGRVGGGSFGVRVLLHLSWERMFYKSFPPHLWATTVWRAIVLTAE